MFFWPKILPKYVNVFHIIKNQLYYLYFPSIIDRDMR